MKYIELNNKIKMPALGYGTAYLKQWQENGDEVTNIISNAIESGYRHIDTAAIYNNEENVGQALKKSSIDRKEFFITSKLWNTEQGYDKTLKAFETSLKKLQLTYLDLYLIHWPCPEQKLYRDTWLALEKLYRDGLIKSIGVSNFTIDHLKDLIASSDIIPAVNQIELHPYFQQEELVKYCKNNGIAVSAWSPLGGTWPKTDKPLEDPIIKTIAEKYSKSPAQIILRYLLELNLIVLPRSSNKERTAQNINVFDFELKQEDITLLKGMDKNLRLGHNPDTKS